MASGGARPRRRGRRSPVPVQPQPNEDLFDRFLNATHGSMRIFWLLGHPYAERNPFVRNLRKEILHLNVADFAEFFETYLKDFDDSKMSKDERRAYYATEEGRIRSFFNFDGCRLAKIVLGVHRVVHIQLRFAKYKIDQLKNEAESGKRKLSKKDEKNIAKMRKILEDSDYGSSAASDTISDLCSVICDPRHRGRSLVIESVYQDSIDSSFNIFSEASVNSSPQKSPSHMDNGTRPTTPIIVSPIKENSPRVTPKKPRRKKIDKGAIKDKQITLDEATLEKWMNRPPKKHQNVIDKLKRTIAKKRAKTKTTVPQPPGCEDLRGLEDFMILWNQRMQDPIRAEIDNDFPPVFDLENWTPDEDPTQSPIHTPPTPPKTPTPEPDKVASSVLPEDEIPPVPPPPPEDQTHAPVGDAVPPLPPADVAAHLPPQNEPHVPPVDQTTVPPEDEPHGPPEDEISQIPEDVGPTDAPVLEPHVPAEVEQNVPPEDDQSVIIRDVEAPASPIDVVPFVVVDGMPPAPPPPDDAQPELPTDVVPPAPPEPERSPPSTPSSGRHSPPPRIGKYLIDNVGYDIYTEHDLMNKLDKRGPRDEELGLEEPVKLTFEASVPPNNSNDYGAARALYLLCGMYEKGRVDLKQEAQTEIVEPLNITIKGDYEGHQEIKARELAEEEVVDEN